MNSRSQPKKATPHPGFGAFNQLICESPLTTSTRRADRNASSDGLAARVLGAIINAQVEKWDLEKPFYASKLPNVATMTARILHSTKGGGFTCPTNFVAPEPLPQEKKRSAGRTTSTEKAQRVADAKKNGTNKTTNLAVLLRDVPLAIPQVRLDHLTSLTSE
jgi:hypothetical protein